MSDDEYADDFDTGAADDVLDADGVVNAVAVDIPLAVGKIAVSATATINISELQLGRLRGGGTFACVYEAVWTLSGERVAVKTLADASVDEAAKAAFNAELRALAGAGSHPNVLRLIGSCLHPRPAIVTELLGVTVAEALARGPPGGASRGAPWPLNTVLRWATGVAAAVAHLHALPIPLLHRDIKSANILLRSVVGAGSEAVLADFGLAGSKERAAGTPTHLAPELWAASDGAHALLGRGADVYALGVCMWSFFAGLEPWAGWTVADIKTAVMAGKRPESSRMRTDTPPQLHALLARAMAAELSDRPSAAEILIQLSEAHVEAVKAAALQASSARAAPIDALDAALGMGPKRKK